MKETHVLRSDGNTHFTDTVGPIHACAVDGLVITCLDLDCLPPGGAPMEEAAVIAALRALAAKYPGRQLVALDWYAPPDVAPALWTYCAMEKVRLAATPEFERRVRAEYCQRKSSSKNRSP